MEMTKINYKLEIGIFFANNLVFGSQNDSPTPAWVSPCCRVSCLEQGYGSYL